MSTISTHIIRIYPKRKKISEIDCQAISQNLADTASELWEKVIYYVNSEENCLDIKYKSRRDGQLGIEDQLEDFDIWYIISRENQDFIGQLYSNGYRWYNCFYQFDAIKIIGNQEHLLEKLYPLFFQFPNATFPPFFLQRAIDQKENDSITFPQGGIYCPINNYSIGEKHSDKAELVTKENFLKPRNSYIEDHLLFQSSFYGIKKLFQSIVVGLNVKELRETVHGLDIQLCYNNRVTRVFKWDGNHSLSLSSDWWDNCIESNWVNYKSQLT